MSDNWEQYAVSNDSSHEDNTDWEKYSAPEKNEKSTKTEQPSKMDIAKDILTGRIFSGQQGKFAPPVGLGQMVARAVPKLAESSVQQAGKYANLLAQQGIPALKSIATDFSGKTARTATAGIGDLLQEMLNIPRNTPQILSNLELLNPDIAKKLTPENQFDLSKYTNKIAGEKYPGSELIRETFKGSPVTLPIAKALIESSKGLAKTATKLPINMAGKTDPILQAQKLQKEMMIQPKEQQLEEAKSNYEQQREQHEQAKISAKREGISTEHEGLVHTLNEHDKKIEEAKLKSEELQSKLNKIKEETPIEPSKLEERKIIAPEKKQLFEPEKPGEISKEHEQKANEYNEKYLQSEENLYNAKENLNNNKKLAKESDKQIANQLNLGSAHNVHVGEYVKKEFHELGETLKSDYGKKVQEVKDAGIKIEIDKIKIPEKQNKLVKRVLKELPKKKEINASTVMTRYKDLRNKIYELGQRKKFSESARERDLISRSMPVLEKVKESFKKVLDSGLGEHADDFKELNRRYVDYYKLKENRARKLATKTGKLNKGMIDQLSGSEVGQDLLRDMIKKNPDMVRHIVGQRYKTNKDILHNPSELEQEYTSLLPNIEKLSEQKRSTDAMVEQSGQHVEQATKNRDIAKKNASLTANEAIRARKEHGKREKEYGEKLKEYKSNVSEQNKAEKDYQKQLSDYEKEKENYHKQLKNYGEQTKEHNENVKKAESNIIKHNKEREELNSEKEKIIKHEKNLREKFNAREISFKDKNRIGKELDKIKKERNSIDDRLDKSATGLVFYIRKVNTLYKAAKRIVRGF